MGADVKPKDPLRLLESVYSFVDSEEAWLAGVVQALLPFDFGRGIAAYVSELGSEVLVRSIAAEGLALDPMTPRKMAELLPPAFYRRIHAPTPVVSSFESFPAAAQAIGLDAATWHGLQDPFQTPDAAWAIAGGDRDVETAIVVFHCSPEEAFQPRDRETLDYVAAHLGSALRLRSVLRRAPDANDEDAVGVVLSPDGTVLDARGDAQDEELRAPLIDAVRRLEKAKLRKATSEERLEVWTALVDGRWSLLESTERDGKRMILACRNNPRTSAMRRLTERERSVVTYGALGHSFKYIAYELGIPLSTAASTFDAALRKLGLASRAELIELFARGMKTSAE